MERGGPRSIAGIPTRGGRLGHTRRGKATCPLRQRLGRHICKAPGGGGHAQREHGPTREGTGARDDATPSLRGRAGEHGLCGGQHLLAGRGHLAEPWDRLHRHWLCGGVSPEQEPRLGSQRFLPWLQSRYTGGLPGRATRWWSPSAGNKFRIIGFLNS